MDWNWVRIDIPDFERRGGRTGRGLEFAERLDRLMVGPANADFVAGDSFDFVRESELMADIERAREGVVFQAGDAEQTPPAMGEQLDLLGFGFRFGGPTRGGGWRGVGRRLRRIRWLERRDGR